MDIIEISEDAGAIIAAINGLGDVVASAILVFAALAGMILGYLSISELLKIWID